jgi:hypothetical protein
LDAAFVVRDRGGQALAAYAYFEDELGRRAAAKLLTNDEARRIAFKGEIDVASNVAEGRLVFCLYVLSRRSP